MVLGMGKLILDDGTIIWENPKESGAFAIKLQKQIYEEKLAEAILKRIPFGQLEDKYKHLQCLPKFLSFAKEKKKLPNRRR